MRPSHTPSDHVAPGILSAPTVTPGTVQGTACGTWREESPELVPGKEPASTSLQTFLLMSASYGKRALLRLPPS